MTRGRLTVLLGLLLASGCQRKAPVPTQSPTARYVVGPAWQGEDGAWFYPSEQPGYRATGLAVVEHRLAGTVADDGESYDPEAVTASVQTLPLPSVVRVTDLENGRSLLVRAIGRGPASPGRLVALSPRAARLLGISAGRPAQVSVVLEGAASQSVAARTQGAPSLDIVAAPVGGVQEQALGPPGSVPGPGAVATPAALQASQQPTMDDAPAVSGEVGQGPATPGSLWIDAGRFSSPGYARQAAALSGGSVIQEGRGRETVYRTRIGPFASVPEADAALDQARHAGVTGARIIVE